MKIQRIVVDANIIISALLKNSTTRNILLLYNKIDFYAPEFIKIEILKYSKFISQKTGINENDLKIVLTRLFETARINVIAKEFYETRLQKAIKISPDLKDAPYLALALQLDCPIWSQDKQLKKQFQIKVYSTAEIMKEIEQQ